jgi:hypothetical protein
VEDYDEWLCGIHYGVLTTLREVTTYMPVDGDEGQIQGRLIEEMSQQLQALEEELAQVNRLLLWVRQRKHLEAAVCVMWGHGSKRLVMWKVKKRVVTPLRWATAW